MGVSLDCGMESRGERRGRGRVESVEGAIQRLLCSCDGSCGSSTVSSFSMCKHAGMADEAAEESGPPNE